MVKIAHISDLHFGRADKAAIDALTQAINDEQPSLTAITGDLTQHGARREFEAAAAFMATLDSPLLAVPGNHDTPVFNLIMRSTRPWARFEKHLGETRVRAARADNVTVIGMNSARQAQLRLDWSYGRLSRRGIAEAADLAARERDSGQTVIVALHHPFAAGPSRAGREIVGNGEKALQRFVASGVSAVMTGHVHQSAAAPLSVTGDRILSIQCGTSGSTRTRGETAGFALLDVQPDALSVHYRHFNDGVYEASRSLDFINRDNRWLHPA